MIERLQKNGRLVPSKLDYDLRDWATQAVRDMNKAGYPSTNAVERILRDPGIATYGSHHKALWWPIWHPRSRYNRNTRLRKAICQLPPRYRICLVVKYGEMKNDDKSLLTKRDLCAFCALKQGDFDVYIKKAKKRIRGILSGYGENDKKWLFFA